MTQSQSNDPGAPARPIHLGFQSRIAFLRSELAAIRQSALYREAFDQRLNPADTETTLKHLAEEIRPT